MGTFFQRTEYLGEQVGTGFITAKCVVDQPYAQDQHETLSYVHTEGRARYLGDPLLENVTDLLEIIAIGAITRDGSEIKEAMIECAELMSMFVFVNAPVDTTALKTSGHPIVEDNGLPIYDRAPISPRERR